MSEEINFHALHRSGVIKHGESASRSIFCASCQVITDHQMLRATDRNSNDQILATCDCSRFVVFPRPSSPEELDAWIAAHQASNVGQITVEQVAAAEAEKDEHFKKMMRLA